MSGYPWRRDANTEIINTLRAQLEAAEASAGRWKTASMAQSEAAQVAEARAEAAEVANKRLTDELGEFFRRANEFADRAERFEARAESAEAESARLRVDAERYAWLRENCQDSADEFDWSSELYFGEYEAGELDAAIDAARAETKA